MSATGLAFGNNGANANLLREVVVHVAHAFVSNIANCAGDSGGRCMPSCGSSHASCTRQEESSALASSKHAAWQLQMTSLGGQSSCKTAQLIISRHKPAQVRTPTRRHVPGKPHVQAVAALDAHRSGLHSSRGHETAVHSPLVARASSSAYTSPPKPHVMHSGNFSWLPEAHRSAGHARRCSEHVAR